MIGDKQKMQPCTEIVTVGFCKYKVPKRSCLLCKNLEDVIYDDAVGPYMFVCYKALGEDNVMDVDLMGGPYGNCVEFSQSE